MKFYLFILLLFLVNSNLNIDITPFKEIEIFDTIKKYTNGYFKINLKDVKDEDKQNLYIQYKIKSVNFGKIFTVDACSFSEEPSEEDIVSFQNSINNIPGNSHSDSYFFYYIYKIPKFENINWLVIRNSIQNDLDLNPTSIYVYSKYDDKENKQNLSFNIAIIIISVINTLLIVFVLFKVLSFEKKLSSITINNKFID